jgi:hypothetical protein
MMLEARTNLVLDLARAHEKVETTLEPFHHVVVVERHMSEAVKSLR